MIEPSASDLLAARLERVARYTPAAIIVYCAVGLAVRLLLSSNLEADESLFVGHLDWAWGYGRSQPPLYQWLVILFVRGLNYWPAIAILKYLSLTATGLLVYDTARRAGGSRVSGAVAALSLAFVHQVIWLSQLTLSHSVLALAAAAATLHALVCVLQAGHLRSFIWLGIAIAVGLLSKYNFAIYLISLAIAAASIRELRIALWRPQLAVTTALFSAAMAPHAWWAAHHPAETMARLDRLQMQTVVFGRRAPLGGLAGIASLIWAVFSSVVPTIAIRALAQWRLPAVAPAVTSLNAQAMRKLCMRAMCIAVGVSAAAVLAGGIKNVPERYFTVLLIPFPIWLALAYPIDRYPLATLLYARFAAASALLCAVALAGRTLFGTTPYAYPYAALASDIVELAQPPFAVFAKAPEQAANVVIRIPGATMFDPAQAPERVLAVWNAADGQNPPFLEQTLAAEYERAAHGRMFDRPYAYFSGKRTQIFAQLWRRKPARQLRQQSGPVPPASPDAAPSPPLR